MKERNSQGGERNLAPLFMGYMLLYLLVVHGWTLYVYPLGLTFARMAGTEWHTANFLIHTEAALFGAWLPGYHLVNIACLYACMAALFFFTRFALRGPWWHGSLAAVLLMANPLKAEATLALDGAQLLFPSLLGLLALMFHAWDSRRPSLLRYVLGALCFWGALLSSQGMLWPLLLVFIAYELLLVDAHRRWWPRLVPHAALTVWALVRLCDWETPRFLHAPLFDRLAPLYLNFYPIGFLPETAAMMRERPWLAWASVFAVLVLLWWAGRRLRHGGFVFGVLGAVGFSLCLAAPVDLVHMLGGHALVIPMALLNCALAACCARISQHPKWRRPVVLLTTVLCVVFFVLHGQTNLRWYDAGQRMKDLQEDVHESGRHGVALLPHYVTYRSAPFLPVCAFWHDTPFSERMPEVIPILPLHCLEPGKPKVVFENWNGAERSVRAEGAPHDAVTIPDAYSGVAKSVERLEGESGVRFHLNPLPFEAGDVLLVTPPGGPPGALEALP